MSDTSNDKEWYPSDKGQQQAVQGMTTSGSELYSE